MALGAAKSKSTTRKILKFDATSSAKGSVISKQLCFSELGGKAMKKMYRQTENQPHEKF